MASIIDYTYFEDGSAKVAGVMTISAVQQNVTRHIVDYEARYLKSLLGLAMYKELRDQLNTDIHVAPDLIWLDILDGKDWTDSSGNTRIWQGLRNAAKVSPIACYVYWHFVENNKTGTTGLGEVKSKAENAENANPIMKQVRAWNKMVELNNELVDYINFNRSVYATWLTPSGYLSRRNELFVTQNPYGI